MFKKICFISIFFLIQFINLIGQDGCPADINKDSKIDGLDFSILIGQYGLNCLVTLPSVLTTSIRDITSSSVEIEGSITNDGGSSIIFTGICWGLNPNPTIYNEKSYETAPIGNFTSQIVGLNNVTIYYARSYATNAVGTAYGEQVIFTTLPQLPVVTTYPVINIMLDNASCGGYISEDGGSPIIQRGVCWSASTIPTVSDFHTSDGIDTGNFFSILSGLTSGTLYRVRSYATNSVGTSYGTEISFYTLFPGLTAIDGDGNIYQVDTIGTQIWLAENLKTTRYNDGSVIPHIPDVLSWSTRTVPAYCWYSNKESIYKAQYGALYNWYTVNTGRLCPAGWHVPTDAEWDTLTIYLGTDSLAGGKLKEIGTTHWAEPNTGATDEFGFTALPGGYRRYNGVFIDERFYGYWWNSNQLDINNSWNIHLNHNSKDLVDEYSNKKCGFSVRCLKD